MKEDARVRRDIVHFFFKVCRLNIFSSMVVDICTYININVYIVMLYIIVLYELIIILYSCYVVMFERRKNICTFVAIHIHDGRYDII